MDAAFLRAFLQNRLAWLLALVLVLPVAQTFAALHLLSHAQSAEVESIDTPHAAGQKACDLCLAAAAIMAGALPVGAVKPLPAATPAKAASTTLVQIWLVPLALAYQSRAPPFTRY
jgi:hypothetical protein